MASEQGKTNQGDGTGFAGLSSMVSDVDATIAWIPEQTPKEASSSSTRQSSQVSRPVLQEQAAPTPQTNHTHDRPSAGSGAGKWLFGIATVIGVIWLANQSDNNSSLRPAYVPGSSQAPVAPAPPRVTRPSATLSPPAPVAPAPPRVTRPSATLSPPAPVAPAPAPAWQQPAAQAQTPSRPTEDKPSVGRNNVLSTAQIRYCLAQKIRLDAAETLLNSSVADADVDWYNGYVEDYNNRCGEFRYQPGTLESAQRDVEPYRSQLQADGRSRFVRSPSAITSSQTPTQVPQRVHSSPDATVKAVQRRLNELGYHAGTADGILGGKTRAAIQAFQRDNAIAADGVASASLLRQMEATVQTARTENRRPKLLPLTNSSSSKSHAPADSSASGSELYCNSGYKQVGSKWCQNPGD